MGAAMWGILIVPVLLGELPTEATERLAYLRRAHTHLMAMGNLPTEAHPRLAQLQADLDSWEAGMMAGNADVDKLALLQRELHALAALRRHNLHTGDEMTAEGASRGFARIVNALVSWALDRPVPWERDCSCCYPFCPQGKTCIRQGEKRYLACAGPSMREQLQDTVGAWYGPSAAPHRLRWVPRPQADGHRPHPLRMALQADDVSGCGRGGRPRREAVAEHS